MSSLSIFVFNFHLLRVMLLGFTSLCSNSVCHIEYHIGYKVQHISANLEPIFVKGFLCCPSPKIERAVLFTIFYKIVSCSGVTASIIITGCQVPIFSYFFLFFGLPPIFSYFVMKFLVFPIILGFN